MADLKQTPVHSLPLAISGLIPFKNAFKRALTYLDKALPAPFVTGDIGKVAKVITDGAGGAKTAWAPLPANELPPFVLADAGKVLTVTNVSGVATLAWVTNAA